MKWNAKWIKPVQEHQDIAPVFLRRFSVKKELKHAELKCTVLGVYEARMNGKRIGDFYMAPGWTAYDHRLQVQSYDVTSLIEEENHLTILTGKGWYRNPLADWARKYQREMMKFPAACTAVLTLTYMDGSQEIIETDQQWTCADSQVLFSELYDGEIVDGRIVPVYNKEVELFDGPTHTLIEQEGEEIHEMEVLRPMRLFVTPKQEVVLDFGQNLTGLIEVCVDAHENDVVDLSFAEVLDKDGNFYTENYRGAKAMYRYLCHEGKQTHHPKLTFWGFRYVRVNEFPGGLDAVSLDQFKAIAIYSNMKQTGYIETSNSNLNQLFSNVLWGQKGNFVDVPTDCPQRDERLGWTGDAQVFVKTACLNYDVETFFMKWLKDLSAHQHEDGYVPHVVPDVLQNPHASTAWGDAAAICPWEVYLAYGNKQVLENQFESMCKWIDYISTHTTTPYLWTGGTHYGDWLGLDAPSGSYKGSSSENLIASAFYARSVELTIKAAEVLQKDAAELKELYENIKQTFQKAFKEYRTQTECVLAAHFKLAEDPQKAADQLAEKVREAGHLETGFVGTPYLLHVLSDYGYSELAYDLLLKDTYPSWLYPVTKGATTVWEHWDGIMENGDFWSADMNSFNHYAYGSVCDWIYTKAAGIQTMEEAPGYQKIRIAPIPDARLDWLKVSVETRAGLVVSNWKKQEDMWRFEMTVPTEAEVVINGKTMQIQRGTSCFFAPVSGKL